MRDKRYRPSLSYHGWRYILRKCSYRSLTTQTLWSEGTRSKSARQSHLTPLQETRRRTRGRSFRPRGSAGENLRNKYLEHVLPDKIQSMISCYSEGTLVVLLDVLQAISQPYVNQAFTPLMGEGMFIIGSSCGLLSLRYEHWDDLTLSYLYHKSLADMYGKTKLLIH